MSVNTEDIINDFTAAYPSNAFMVLKFKIPGGCSWHCGFPLLRVQLQDDDYLDIYKLSSSSGPVLSDNDVKAKALPFVYDTKSETSSEKRRDSLCDSLKTVFPQHNVNIFIFGSTWQANWKNCKGATRFMKEYGTDVLVVLS